MNHSPGCILAGIQSRCGKTTLMLALLSTLRRTGIQVAPFKAGPDFIDPLWHQIVCAGLSSYHLDTHMMGEQRCRALFGKKRGASMGIVEGVMGLYDGRSGTGVGGAGSTADLARVLGLPVILVVDARGMAGSLVPLVEGFVRAADGFSIAGVLANRVGSATHANCLTEYLNNQHLPPLLGWMIRDEQQFSLKERHLGLTLPEEKQENARDINQFSDGLTLDVNRFLKAIAGATKQPPVFEDFEIPKKYLSGKTIAIAQDRAFCFIYPANLDCLIAMGATLRFFSPLSGDHLPKQCDALWLPGGYPELFGAELSRSASWPEIRAWANQGGTILAECGGMMALGESLTDLDGNTWSMGHVLPIKTHMTRRLVGLGYREEKTGSDDNTKATGLRGHEFHHSRRETVSDLPAAFSLKEKRGDVGVRWRNVRASYVHWYFPSDPKRVASYLSGHGAGGGSRTHTLPSNARF